MLRKIKEFPPQALFDPREIRVCQAGRFHDLRIVDPAVEKPVVVEIIRIVKRLPVLLCAAPDEFIAEQAVIDPGDLLPAFVFGNTKRIGLSERLLMSVFVI